MRRSRVLAAREDALGSQGAGRAQATNTEEIWIVGDTNLPQERWVRPITAPASIRALGVGRQ